MKETSNQSTSIFDRAIPVKKTVNAKWSWKNISLLPKLSAKPRRPLAIGLLLFVFVVLAWQYQSARQEVRRLSDSQATTNKIAETTRDKVAKIAEIPTDETPQLQVVGDVSKLKGSAFFAKAQKNDKVMVFAKAKRAILYRPSTNKVIEITSIDTTDGQPQATGANQ